ncbi:MAG TPA: MFS transporter [Thermoanaerobaculia bacterium]|nr:MFS transporter [Thermoanaerobaculia bacterium]
MDTHPTRQLDKGVWALGWVSFLSDVASDMIYPLLPDFLTRTLHAGPAALGLIEGVAEATASIMKAVSGWWSDRFRRRKPLVVAGYAIAAAARPLVGVAASWVQVLAIRFADRVGKGIRTSPRDALLADLVPSGERGRAYGLQRAMDNAGAVAGPLLAAALLKWVFSDERSVFLLAAVPGAIAIAVLVLRVRETPRRAEETPRTGAPPSAEGPLPARLWMLLGIFVLFALASSTDAFLLLKARDSGVPLWQLPLLWAAFNGVKAAAGVPGGALADRLGHVRTILAGWAVYAVSYIAFAFAGTAREVWGVFAFYALFYALTEGAERALVADLVRADSRGRAFGAFHASTGLASLPASVLFGVLWKAFGPHVAFLVGAGIAVVSAAALAAWRVAGGEIRRAA